MLLVLMVAFIYSQVSLVRHDVAEPRCCFCFFKIVRQREVYVLLLPTPDFLNISYDMEGLVLVMICGGQVSGQV